MQPTFSLESLARRKAAATRSPRLWQQQRPAARLYGRGKGAILSGAAALVDLEGRRPGHPIDYVQRPDCKSIPALRCLRGFVKQ